MSKRALDALLVITEAARDDRRGSADQARIAGFVDGSRRTVSRAVTELVDRGLVVVLRKGGSMPVDGSGQRRRFATKYYVVPVVEWLGGPPTHATQGGARTSPTGATQDGAGTAPPHRPTRATMDGASRAAPEGLHAPFEGPTRATQDGALPVVLPVSTSGGTTDVTTGPRTHEPAPTPTAPGSETLSESLCHRPDCPAPRPCRWCGEARRASQAREASPADRSPASVRFESATLRNQTGSLASRAARDAARAIYANRPKRKPPDERPSDLADPDLHDHARRRAS